MIYKDKRIKREIKRIDNQYDSVSTHILQFSNNSVKIWNTKEIPSEEFFQKVQEFRDSNNEGIWVEDLIKDEIHFHINKIINERFNLWMENRNKLSQ